MMTLDNWKRRLAGEAVPTHEGTPEPGFYRIRKKDASTNQVWWTPVAYFYDGEELVGVIGDRNMNDNEVGDLWTFVCHNPIPEEVYFQFDSRVEVPNEEWPAGLLGAPKRPVFANASVANGPVVTAEPLKHAHGDLIHDNTTNNPPAEEQLPLDQQFRQQIEAAVGAAPKKVPTTADEAAVAEGSRNRIAELRLAADKAGRAIYDPIFRAYKAEQSKWSPIITTAETAEKAINKLVLTFKENERKRIAAEQAEAARKQKEIDDAAEAAAQRAIIAAQAGQQPTPAAGGEVVWSEQGEEIVLPPPPAPVTAAPAPAPTYGTRRVQEKLKTFVVVDDWAVLATFFKDNSDVQALLTKLAQKDVDAGRTVPGTHTREGLI